MRYLLGLFALAAIVLVSGCSLFRNPDLSVAKVTSISAPDTVIAGATFSVTYHVILGSHGLYELDHIEVVEYTSSCLAQRFWSHDFSDGGAVPCILAQTDATIGLVAPKKPGPFRLVAIQPDQSALERTVTVLP